jgi:hypothetical protein
MLEKAPRIPWPIVWARTTMPRTISFAVEHPSQPNYLDLFSGSNQGVTDDGSYNITGPNLARSLLNAGLTFGGYSEDLPYTGFTGDTSGAYTRWDSPWVSFTNLPASLSMPFSSFPSDYSQLPTVSFVIPNLNDDMHDGTVAQGDAWLQSNLGGYAQWAQAHNSLLIVTWDEDDGSQNNQIPTLFVGAMVQPGQYGEQINHYSVLRTVEDMYGLPHLANDASAAPISDIWATGLAAPTNLTATAASSSEIDLNWNAAAGATSYTVQRSPDGSSWAQLATGVSGTRYADAGLDAGTTHAAVGSWTTTSPPLAGASTCVAPAAGPGASSETIACQESRFKLVAVRVSGAPWGWRRRSRSRWPGRGRRCRTGRRTTRPARRRPPPSGCRTGRPGRPPPTRRRTPSGSRSPAGSSCRR